MEFKLPVGVMRVGRQESHWGMGLLANHGNGFDDLFGDNHWGATFDRIMFATQPLAIAQTIMGRPVTNVPLYAVFGVDRLVEDPLIEYYGYTCEEDIQEGSVTGSIHVIRRWQMVGQTSITITPMKIEPIHNEGTIGGSRQSRRCLRDGWRADLQG